MLRKSLHRENAHVFLYSIILYLFLFATLFLSLISLLKVFFSLKLYIANAQKEQNNVQTFISTNSVFHNYIFYIHDFTTEYHREITTCEGCSPRPPRLFRILLDNRELGLDDRGRRGRGSRGRGGQGWTSGFGEDRLG